MELLSERGQLGQRCSSFSVAQLLGGLLDEQSITNDSKNCTLDGKPRANPAAVGGALLLCLGYAVGFVLAAQRGLAGNAAMKKKPLRKAGRRRTNG